MVEWYDLKRMARTGRLLQAAICVPHDLINNYDSVFYKAEII